MAALPVRSCGTAMSCAIGSTTSVRIPPPDERTTKVKSNAGAFTPPRSSIATNILQLLSYRSKPASPRQSRTCRFEHRRHPRSVNRRARSLSRTVVAWQSNWLVQRVLAASLVPHRTEPECYRADCRCWWPCFRRYRPTATRAGPHSRHRRAAPAASQSAAPPPYSALQISVRVRPSPPTAAYQSQ